MEKELGSYKIKNCYLGIIDLIEMNLFDYSRGGIMSNDYGWTMNELGELSNALLKYLKNDKTN